MKLGKIVYPYLPERKEFHYVALTNHHMLFARWVAKQYSLDSSMPSAAVIVKNKKVFGFGASGSVYHKEHGCQRVLLGCKTGEGYELCEGCHPNNHSEPKAIANAKKRGYATLGTDLYLWGHWWCCKSCWDKMIRAGIARVFLLEGSHILFNKGHPENIVGRQFDY